MPTSGEWVSTSWPRLINCSSSLVETTDWRAGCGKSARPVRREGEANHLSLPLYTCEARLRARRSCSLAGAVFQLHVNGPRLHLDRLFPSPEQSRCLLAEERRD